MLRPIAIIWGLGGVLYILGHAIYGLLPRTVEALGMPLGPHHLVFGVLWLAFMAYSEGYRGFQLRFSPRVVARAWYLAEHPRPLHLLLAPVFCMGFFYGSRRRLITSWAITVAIVAIVLVVRLVPQPWRGLVDLGVVVGLGWGSLAIVVFAIQAALAGGTDEDPQLPPGAVGATS